MSLYSLLFKLTSFFLFFSNRGILKWPDGTVYCGTFKKGLEDGLVHRHTVYDGHA